MSYSSSSQNFVEKSFFFLELFQKNMRGVILNNGHVNRTFKYVGMYCHCRLVKKKVENGPLG